ncbi:MAG: glycoside hydrolase family 20 zincin-like fold domain-containing protein [Phycisphaerae bacterium]
MLAPCPSFGAEAPEFRTKFDRDIVPGRPSLVCARVEKGPAIDGEVDKDPVWQALSDKARTHGAWSQLARKDASGRQTVVYSCFDNQNLYFAFVCEEGELQGIRMDGNLTQPGKMVGPDDCVEAIIEVGGVQGEGEAYSFRANLRGHHTGWGLIGVPPNLGYHTPEWKSAGKFGPNRWMVEMAVPFDTIKRRPGQKGMPVPARGDVIGLKLVRYGSQQSDPKNRMVSTWNTDIATPLIYVTGCNGLLYFEDASALDDGDFTRPDAQSPWKRTGDVSAPAEGKTGLVLAAGASVSQAAAVHPSSYYLLRVEHEPGQVPEVQVDGKPIAMKDGGTGIWTAGKQDKLTLALAAKGSGGPVALKRVALEYQPSEEPQGVWCLTNNYRRADRNVRSLVKDAPDGRYQYVAIDYAGRITGDNNPSIDMKVWSFDYSLRIEDLGGREGWIPFSKGSLTGRPEAVFWQTDNPAGYPWGRHTQVLDIDLGAEYYVRGLDVLWPGPNVENFEIWGKLKDEDEWTYLYAGDGQYVEPSQRRKHRRGYESVRGLDSVVRFLRWRAFQVAGDALVGPQLDGIQEFWVWGQPLSDQNRQAGIKPFKPWVPDKTVPPVKAETAVLNPDAPLIIPRPRKLDKVDGWFVIGPRTRIVAQDQAEARKVARQIHDEVHERWQIDVPVQTEGTGDKGLATRPAGDLADNVIYLGVLGLGGAAGRVADEEGLFRDKADRDRPQAYGLSASPKRVVVIGRDDDGLYWGVQSLMMALRWKSADNAAAAGPACRGMKIADWPGTFDRSIYNHKGYAAILNVPASEVPRVKRLCRLLSRFKFNAIYVNPSHGDGQTWAYTSYSWPKGTMARLCREIRDECHVEIRPMLLTTEGMGGSWWRNLLSNGHALDTAENDPDENVRELGVSTNACPLDPKTYELAFEKIDQTLEDYANPGKVWMWGQAYADPSMGARWAICRRCQKSGKTPEEIYAYFLGRVAEHLAMKDTRGLLVSPFLRYGERDPKDHRMISMDIRDVPKTLRVSLPEPEQCTEAVMEAVKAALAPAQCANGPRNWPAAERWVRGPWTETEVLVSLAGGNIEWGNGSVFRDGTMAELAETLWYSPDAKPPGRLDLTDLGAWVYGWWFRRELPGWRAGSSPGFFTLDLRPFANHDSRATGTETLEPGRPPEIDLRYVPTGKQVLGNVQFDIIDPARNNGKSILMLGRPPKSVLPKVAATIGQKAGPIPVGRRLASLAFLSTRWQCTVDSGMHWGECWLRPTCRVVFDDDTWLVVDAFQYPVEGVAMLDWHVAGGLGLYARIGWAGNCPSGQGAGLPLVEWVNPYPEKVVKCLDFFMPDFNGRVNSMCEAIAAITAIEPVEQDLTFWSKRQDRPPLLQPPRPPADPARLLKPLAPAISSYEAANAKGGFADQLAIGDGKFPYELKLAENTLLSSPQSVYCNQSFSPLGVTLTFGSPISLGRVEVLGPHHAYGNIGPREQRCQKIDVTVEISQDGRTWTKAGEVRGTSAEADFQAVDLPGGQIKALRLTGNAEPYRESYHPAQFWGGMFNHVGNCPHFAWRLFAADGGPGKKDK